MRQDFRRKARRVVRLYVPVCLLAIVLGGLGGALLGARKDEEWVSKQAILLALNQNVSAFSSSPAPGNQDRIVLDELARFRSDAVVASTAATSGLSEQEVRDRVTA